MSKSSTIPAGKATKGTATKQQPAASVAPTTAGMQDKIAMRAYQKWLLNGCEHGCDQKHWLEAEAEIKAELAKTARA